MEQEEESRLGEILAKESKRLDEGPIKSLLDKLTGGYAFSSTEKIAQLRLYKLLIKAFAGVRKAYQRECEQIVDRKNNKKVGDYATGVFSDIESLLIHIEEAVENGYRVRKKLN